jgi:hypothetical protein
MQGAFGTVMWLVLGVGVVVAVVTLLLTNRTWREFGKNALLMDRDLPRGPAPGSAAAGYERDAEIRQLLEARNARRLRRGEPPLDIEQELARLTAPLIDPELRQEIRDLVMARNARRLRRGQAPLDVDAEIEREIGRLSEI